MINLDNSRRTYNIRCKWWKPVFSRSDLSKLKHEEKSEGIFYAREHQPKNQTENIDNDLTKIELELTVIETQDKVDDLVHDCLVEYMSHIWIVENIQSQIINKRSEFDVRPAKITWISLRKGAD